MSVYDFGDKGSIYVQGLHVFAHTAVPVSFYEAFKKHLQEKHIYSILIKYHV